MAAQGLALLQIYTLGGVKPDGSDACNDLTKICMQASVTPGQRNPLIVFEFTPGFVMNIC